MDGLDPEGVRPTHEETLDLMATSTQAIAPDRVSLVAPGLLTGVGFGMFVDGIVLHQLLQWHHLFSNGEADRVGLPDRPSDTVDGLEFLVLWDGVFHAAAWVVVLVGLLWTVRRVAAAPRAGSWSPRSLVGLLIAGWGGFQAFDMLVNHQLLAVHQIREDVADPLLWDLGYLAVALLLVAAGTALHRTASR